MTREEMYVINNTKKASSYTPSSYLSHHGMTVITVCTHVKNSCTHFINHEAHQSLLRVIRKPVHCLRGRFLDC